MAPDADSNRTAPKPKKASVESINHVEDLDSLAARYTEFEKSLSIGAALRIYWRAVFWILYGQLVVFGFGIDGNIAANILAIPKFREDYGYRFNSGPTVSYIISANWIAAFSGVSQLTAIIGALTTGVIADKIGRRWTNLIFCIVSLGGVAAQYWSHGSLAVLTVGKGINGFSVGAWLIIGPLYASEVAPLPLRGILTAMTNIIAFSGVLLFTGVLYCVGSDPSKFSYQLPFACQWIVPAIVILTIWFWSESPVWLVRQGRIAAAEKSLRRLYGSNERIDKRGILAQIETTLAAEHSRTATYRECFSSKQRSRTLICMFVYGCQYLSGVVFVLGYQTYYYQLTGYSAEKSFMLTMVNNGLQFFANICSWFLLATLGQRSLIVWGQLCGAVCLFVIGGLSTSVTHTTSLAAVIFIFIWSFTYQLTLGAAAWTVVAVIPSLRFRSRTQGLANLTLCFTQWLIGFIFPYMFNPDAGNLQGKVGFVFGATTLIGFIGVYFFLPETKDKSAAELEKLYNMGVSPRNFQDTQTQMTSTQHNG